MADNIEGKPQTASVSPQLIRQLPMAMILTLLVVAGVLSSVILLTGQPSWWGAFIASTAVGLVCAVASVIIILSSAGKPADYVVTMVMLLAGVRIGISLIGLIVGIKLFALPAEVTAMMICGYYAAMLIIESLLVRRALNVPSASTDTLRGNQG